MILATRHAGNREVRFGSLDAYTARPYPFERWGISAAGTGVTTENASGLPAVGNAIRLVAGVIGTMCLRIYRGEAGQKTLVPNAPQETWLRGPTGMSEFDWLWDIAVSLESTGNALLLKAKASGRVVELVPVPADCWTGRTDRGTKLFDVVVSDGKHVTLTESDVVHVRGPNLFGGPFGVSRIHQHRDPIGAQIAAQTYEGAYLRNHARPDVAIMFPQGITREQAEQWRDVWNSEYGGPNNAGKPLPLGGGATIQPIPVSSMRDQEWVANRQLGIADIGRIMDVDAVLLGGNTMEADDRQGAERFLRFQLPPRLRRIERALKADLDLFPLGDTSYPAFDVNELMFADPLTRAQVQHQQIQNGSLLVDEARADNGRPPLPDGQGQIPQVTPVGGAPNPASEPDTDDMENE